VTGRLDRHAIVFALAAAAVVVFSWPFASLAPGAGIDPSWQAALNMGAYHGLDWGRDLVWTSGPLGYLKTPLLFYGRTFEAAMVYSLAIRVATAAVLIVAIRRTLPAAVAVVVAWLTMSFLTEDPALVLAVVVALLLLERAPAGRNGLLLVAGLGAWAAFETLGKLSIGAVILVVLAVGVGAPREDRARRLAAFAGGAMAGLVVLWLARGQSLGALPDYIRYSFSVVFGYSGAMGAEDQAAGWHYWAALGIALVALLGAAWRRADRLRAAAVAIVAIFLFGEFKEAFVRHDDAHVLYFFTAALCVVPALGWGRRRWIAAVVATVLVAVPVIAVMDGAGAVAPGDSWSALRGQVRQMADRKRRNDGIAAVRSGLAGLYAVDPKLLSLVAGRPTHVLPYEASVAWAYQLDWRPLPVFQDYQAYTSTLDDLNADRLAGRDGPERILRRVESTVDGRFTRFDPPREYVELFCNFRQLGAAGAWQVLGRIPDRCGAQRPLGPVRKVAWGESVKAPAAPAGSAVVAYVDGLAPGGLERLRGLLLRPVNRYVDVAGARYRLVPAVASDGLLVSAPAGSDHDGPFGIAAQTPALAFFRGKGRQPAGRPLRVTFKAMPVR
jgi:hypothetical protein